MLCKHQLHETWFLRLDIPAPPPAISSRWQVMRRLSQPRRRGRPALWRRPWPTCLSWTRPGVHHSHWLPSARPNTVPCWRKGRGARVGHGDSFCYRVKEPLNLFLFPSYTSFSPEDPRNVFLISIPQPPSYFFVLGVVWLTECVCLQTIAQREGWTCSGHILTDPQCVDLRSQTRCSTEMTPGEKDRLQGEVRLGPLSSFHILNYCFCCLVAKPCQLFPTPWTVAPQAPLSMGFSSQEYWSGFPFPSPGDLPDSGIKCLWLNMISSTLWLAFMTCFHLSTFNSGPLCPVAQVYVSRAAAHNLKVERTRAEQCKDVLAKGWCPGQECSWLSLREDLSAVTGGALLLE